MMTECTLVRGGFLEMDGGMDAQEKLLLSPDTQLKPDPEMLSEF